MRKFLFDFCFAASAGGHLSQLLHILSLLDLEEKSAVFVSTSSAVSPKIKNFLSYKVCEANRQSLWKLIALNYQCVQILIRHKPKIVFSTGAAVGFLCCFWGKLFGAKVIWVDSIANTKRLSLSGRMIRPFADLILSQWPQVAKKYPNVEYVGELV